MLSLDVALWVAGLILEIGFAVLLLFRRMHRQFPLFFTYNLWTITSDLIAMVIRYRYFHAYFLLFFVCTAIDSLLQFAVFLELGWSIFKPVRAALLRPAASVLLAVVVLTGMFALPFAGGPRYPGLSLQWQALLGLQQTSSILRILLWLTLAGSSQLLALGWRERELKIATGLGFYSLLTLAASFLHAQPFSRPYWHRIDQVVVISYLTALLFWVASFLQREQPREPFNARMQAFLLALAQMAHADRLALQTSVPSDTEEGALEGPSCVVEKTAVTKVPRK